MAVQSLQSRTLARFKGITHHFEFEYLKSKHVPVGRYISSPVFRVGGYDWALDFHPRGDAESDGSYASLYLRLVSEAEEVQAEYSFSVLDKTGRFVPFDERIMHIFNGRVEDRCAWGYSEFVSRKEIESRYCKDGLLVVSCKIEVLHAACRVSSGGLHGDIENIWGKGEGVDVTFEVDGEEISAHRFILAARSPVFKAMLYGPWIEAKSSCVRIDNMKAEVFKALLRFMYTDDFNFEHQDLEILSIEFVRDLYVAANRYDLRLLKAQCEQRFWVTLSVNTVLATLILAEQHSSAWLKEKCLEFASKSENFTHLALTEGYVQMMQSFPSLLLELRQKIESSSDLVTNAAKKQNCSGGYQES